jgi:hypothetical protein
MRLPRRIVGRGYRPSPLQGAFVAQMPIWPLRTLVRWPASQYLNKYLK